MGDFNKRLGKNPALMAQICSNHDVQDTLTALYPHHHDSSTYGQGKTQLDYILISNNMPLPTRVGHNLYD